MSAQTKLTLSDELIAKHAEKLKLWLKLLEEVMPDYFFQTFTPRQVEEMLPMLFHLHQQKGIQQLTSEDSVTLMYFRTDENNMMKTARMMRDYEITGAVIHKSKQQIVVEGAPRTLFIERYMTSNPIISPAPLFSKTEIVKEYKKKFRKEDPGLDEIYNRVNWDAVSDLTIERLVDRLNAALKVQAEDYIDASLEKVGKSELRLTLSLSNCPKKNFYTKIIECLMLNGVNVLRAYQREITRQSDEKQLKRMPVTIITLYVDLDDKDNQPSQKTLENVLREIPHIKWTNMDDLFYSELVVVKKWPLAPANFVRAAAEFIHAQFSYVDRNEYTYREIMRLVCLYEPLMCDVAALFETRFNPDITDAARDKKLKPLRAKIEKSISAINTGMRDKDKLTKNIFRAILSFIDNILKTNYFWGGKTALSFRMNPAFMKFYEEAGPAYAKAFPAARPLGIFYFYRDKCLGFHVRFAEIARGGWRTVIPRNAGHELERTDSYDFAKDEIFKEVYVLAHTQHMKNKDIYEGGSKIICLLDSQQKNSGQFLYEAQRSVSRAFLDIINYDEKGALKNQRVMDYLGRKEIIEIGPDENMFDVMIEWISSYAENAGYILKGGFISGKPDAGFNHKEYGVTSFGVHQYFLKTLSELGINPLRDAFSVKISGGPSGDVAGNELKLLLQKDASGKGWLYPLLKIVAITDGPAAAFDPDGLDRDELSALALKHSLDKFPGEKLRGEGAYIIFSESKNVAGVEKFRILERKGGKLAESMLIRDEFMKIFQDNLTRHYADVFMPCGGRPSTINISNWREYILDSGPSSKAIVEGANSFITPEARDLLQEQGVWIIKDASANKCGVITSSYEIISGLILGSAEFIKAKPELIKQVMEILRERASKEAAWLFHNFKKSGVRMTELTEQLSLEINRKNEEIAKFLDKKPEYIRNDIILAHLPALFRKTDPKLLDRLPIEYKKAIVSVELACRIIYGRSENLEDEVCSAIDDIKKSTK